MKNNEEVRNDYVFDEIAYLKDIILKTEIRKENRADVAGVLEMIKYADVSDYDVNSESPFEEIVGKYAERSITEKTADEYGEWVSTHRENVKEYEQKYGEGDNFFDTSLDAWEHSVKESLMGDINGIKRMFALESLANLYKLSANLGKFSKIEQDPDLCIDLLEDAHDKITLTKCPADIDDAVDEWTYQLSRGVESAIER